MGFGIIAFVFDYRITGLLATSGLLAMIIGLAIQTNLSNIFSGIAVNLERPFRIGDWVKLADFDEGKVVNVTWRSVRIRTPNNHIISIPNSTAAGKYCP
uniref:Small-conductance mechanosensitive channel n=1 Tax=Candidatus Kentrum sp. LFY TaxID=2126342 RepID=A0A450X781_9GAMM|nr:MAG: Mechanosensitive ion channel [Candidatus Kentron sp. LFY]